MVILTIDICKTINKLSPDELEKFEFIMQTNFCIGLTLDRRFELLSDYLQKNNLFYLGSNNEHDYFYDLCSKRCFNMSYTDVLRFYGYLDTLRDKCLTGTINDVQEALTTLYETCRDIDIYNEFISSIPFEKVDIDDYYRVFGKFKDKVWVEIETGIAFMHGNKKIKF